MSHLSQELTRTRIESAQALFRNAAKILFIPTYDTWNGYAILMTDMESPSSSSVFTMLGPSGGNNNDRSVLRGICTILTLSGFDVYYPMCDNPSLRKTQLFDAYDDGVYFVHMSTKEAYELAEIEQE